MISFVKRMSEVLEVDKILPKRSNEEEEVDMDEHGNRCPQLSVFTVAGALFFGAADRLESTLTRSINRRPEVLALIINRASLMDATGEANLPSLITDIQKQGGKLLISGVKPEVLDMMKTSGLYETVGEENFYEDATDAINQG